MRNTLIAALLIALVVATLPISLSIKSPIAWSEEEPEPTPTTTPPPLGPLVVTQPAASFGYAKPEQSPLCWLWQEKDQIITWKVLEEEGFHNEPRSIADGTLRLERGWVLKKYDERTRRPPMEQCPPELWK